MDKIKILFGPLLILLSLSVFAPTAFAAEKIFLDSTITSVKDFKEIYVEKFVDYEGEEGYEVTIEDEVDEDGIMGYSIVIDIEKGTYETSQLSQEEIIREYQEDMVGNDDEPIDVEGERLLLHITN